MRLSELFVCIALFLLFAVIFSEAFAGICMREKNIRSSILDVVAVIQADRKIRREMRAIPVSYWKNFTHETSGVIKRMEQMKIAKGVEIISVKKVYGEKKRVDGIQIAWEYKGKIYVAQEYIKPRLVDER